MSKEGKDVAQRDTVNPANASETSKVTEATEATEVPEPGNPMGALVLGILGVIAWVIPLLGLPLTITGLIAGVNGLRRENRGMAVAGVVLCSLGMLLSLINLAVGAYLSAIRAVNPS
jgi:hypothetical protein